jgi:DNA-binding transcriptional LysR family regulator
MALNLGHLAVFHAVAETGSVTLGAQRLMVSQPAVSKQVKELERALQTRLFDRRPKGVRLTDAGRVLADYAGRIFALASEAEAAVSDATAMRRGSLAVGASPTLGTYLLPRALVYFRQRFPGVRVRLEIEPSHLLRARLNEGALDLGVTNADLRWPELDASTLMHDELVAIAPPDHPLARKRRVTPEVLCREPFIVRETGSETRSLVERSLAAAGYAIEPALSLSSTEAVKQAVAAGLGVAMVSKLVIGDDVSNGRLAVLRLTGLTLRRPVHLVRPPGRVESKAAAAFVCVLRHAARGSLPARGPAAPPTCVMPLPAGGRAPRSR